MGRVVELGSSGRDDTMKSFIRNLSRPAEFCLILFICFGLSIAAASIWIINHLGHAPQLHGSVVVHPANKDVIHLKNDGIVAGVVNRQEDMIPPHKAPQPTPIGRLSSAFAVDIARPAWLSLIR